MTIPDDQLIEISLVGKNEKRYMAWPECKENWIRKYFGDGAATCAEERISTNGKFTLDFDQIKILFRAVRLQE